MEIIDVYTLADHSKILYQLLAKRSVNAQISHQNLPSFEEHCAFVDSHPYLHWYVIYIDEHAAGTAYITDMNTIGLSLSSEYASHMPAVLQWLMSHHTPLPEIKSKRIPQFSININPANQSLILAVKAVGGQHVQNTYVF